MFFIYVVMWFYLGAVLVILCATVYLCCANFLRVPCLRIQRGCKCEKVSWDTAGSGTSRESRLSDTPIVWRNSSVTFARDHRIHTSILARGINVCWIQCVMVGFVVPVLADNLLAYSLVLVSLHWSATFHPWLIYAFDQLNKNCDKCTTIAISICIYLTIIV